jgi:hypothetical protein
MERFFTRERFGSPQVIAGAILLMFLGQCIWFSSKVPLSDREVAYIMQGQHEWKHGLVSFHDQASPVTGLVAALPLLSSSAQDDVVPPSWRWLARAPFMLIGALLGASIWYVARRLYGNVAGFIALILYSFSPLAVVHGTLVQPDVTAEWGGFAAIFTAIGVAHTLYAPREVILWNWRRILLLGIALGVAAGAQLSVVVLIPIAMIFMWYLVPERRGAATVIMLAGCAIAAVVLWASYGLHYSQLAQGFTVSHISEFHPEMYLQPITYSYLVDPFRRQPTVFFLLLVSLVTFVAWKKVRFFGTAAPLLVVAILIGLGIGMPHQGGLSFFVGLALTFGFVFIAGVATDLLESKHAPIALGLVMGVLLGHVVLSISGLLRM